MDAADCKTVFLSEYAIYFLALALSNFVVYARAHDFKCCSFLNQIELLIFMVLNHVVVSSNL